MQQSNSTRVAVITKLGCAFCKKAKTELNNASIPFQEVNLDDEIDTLTKLKQITGLQTLPQIFVNGVLIGGATELIEKMKDGSFQQLIDQSTGPPLPLELQKLLNPQSPRSQSSSSSKEILDIQNAMLSSGLGMHETPFSLHAAIEWLKSNELSIKVLTDLQSSHIITLDSHSHPQNSTINAQTPLITLVPLPPATTPTSPSAPITAIDTKYIFLQWVSMIPLNKASLTQQLNTHYEWFGASRPAIEVSSDLRQAILSLYDAHMSSDGARIRYRDLANDPNFKKFVDATAELQHVDVSCLNRQESMSFWLNIYNALIVHATTVFGPAKNTLERLQWFDSVSYCIQGMKFSTNDIEHGVLRGNAPSPASFLSILGFSKYAPKTFSSKESSKMKLSIHPIDPRIHFALNCGAVSCPPIRVYTPDRLELGLESAAVAFCGGRDGNVRVNVEKRSIALSSIFKWYGGDFGDKNDLFRFLMDHVSEDTKNDLMCVLKHYGGDAHAVPVEYLPYDWSVNAEE